MYIREQHIKNSLINVHYTRNNHGDIVYSINNNRKTLPLKTILTALNDSNKGIVINRAWYRNLNQLESRSIGCNLGVLRDLINRYNSIK